MKDHMKSVSFVPKTIPAGGASRSPQDSLSEDRHRSGDAFSFYCYFSSLSAPLVTINEPDQNGRFPVSDRRKGLKKIHNAFSSRIKQAACHVYENGRFKKPFVTSNGRKGLNLFNI